MNTYIHTQISTQVYKQICIHIHTQIFIHIHTHIECPCPLCMNMYLNTEIYVCHDQSSELFWRRLSAVIKIIAFITPQRSLVSLLRNRFAQILLDSSICVRTSACWKGGVAGTGEKKRDGEGGEEAKGMRVPNTRVCVCAIDENTFITHKHTN